jgi:hypothetical protein
MANYAAIGAEGVDRDSIRAEEARSPSQPPRIPYDAPDCVYDPDTCPEGEELEREYELSVEHGGETRRPARFWVRDRLNGRVQMIDHDWNGVEHPRQIVQRMGMRFPSTATVIWSGQARFSWGGEGRTGEDDAPPASSDRYDAVPEGVLQPPSAPSLDASLVGASFVIQPGVGGDPDDPPPPGEPRYGIRLHRISVHAIGQNRVPEGAPEGAGGGAGTGSGSGGGSGAGGGPLEVGTGGFAPRGRERALEQGEHREGTARAALARRDCPSPIDRYRDGASPRALDSPRGSRGDPVYFGG